MRNRIIQVRHYSRKMMIMMLTGAICCSSCFCETAFAKTSKVRVYDAEKGTTSFTSFTYSDNKKDESLAPSEGTEAISSASQKVVIFHQADGSTIIRKADSNGKVTLPAIRNRDRIYFSWMEHEAGSDSESAVSGGTGDTGKEENPFICSYV